MISYQFGFFILQLPFYFQLRFSPQHEILKFNNVHSSEQSQRAETEKLNRPIQLSGHSPIALMHELH